MFCYVFEVFDWEIVVSYIDKDNIWFIVLVECFGVKFDLEVL